MLPPPVEQALEPVLANSRGWLSAGDRSSPPQPTRRSPKWPVPSACAEAGSFNLKPPSTAESNESTINRNHLTYVEILRYDNIMNEIINEDTPNSLGKQLRVLYGASPIAKAIFDDFKGRTNKVSSTSVDQLMKLTADGSPIARGQVIEVLKGFQAIGLGTFKSGRRGRPSRMEWDSSMHVRKVGEIAAGGTEEPETAGGPKPDTQVCQFPVRPGFNVRFELPADLKLWEAKRFAAHIETLAYEPPNGSEQSLG